MTLKCELMSAAADRFLAALDASEAAGAAAYAAGLVYEVDADPAMNGLKTLRGATWVPMVKAWEVAWLNAATN